MIHYKEIETILNSLRTKDQEILDFFNDGIKAFEDMWFMWQEEKRRYERETRHEKMRAPEVEERKAQQEARKNNKIMNQPKQNNRRG